ncbi:hypothetical protein Ate01nite_30230 [Actinoplanes teichomyceticus]|nr:hypothetical protein Ate01nite_30230 [Actinoplanes teichomyceticus]
MCAAGFRLIGSRQLVEAADPPETAGVEAAGLPETAGVEAAGLPETAGVVLPA